MIRLPEISVENTRKFYKDTYSRMCDMLLCVGGNTGFERIIRYCSTGGQLDDGKVERLLVGDISVLKDAIDQIGIIEDTDVENKFENAYKNFCNRKLGRNWAQMIGVTVCPYCNRSYIFTSNKRGTRPQYDHYFPKSKYPYLALSMHNLIPCCAVCNGLKHDEDTYETPFIYPYKDSYGEQVTFEENGVNADNIESWLGAAREYEIKIRYADEIDGVLKSKIEHAATTFRLEELYSKHGDYVRDILRTAYIYNDDYFEGLVTQYLDLFHSKQEAKNFVFFNYLEEGDWGKRILAKLTHDIAQKVSG